MVFYLLNLKQYSNSYELFYFKQKLFLLFGPASTSAQAGPQAGPVAEVAGPRPAQTGHQAGVVPKAAGPQPAQAGVQAGVMPELAGLLAGQAGAQAGARWRAGR